MDSVDTYIEGECLHKFLYRIFKRHDVDKDNKLNIIEFRKLMKNFEDRTLTDKEVKEAFKLI